jgi:hypothetical protein
MVVTGQCGRWIWMLGTRTLTWTVGVVVVTLTFAVVGVCTFGVTDVVLTEEVLDDTLMDVVFPVIRPSEPKDPAWVNVWRCVPLKVTVLAP